MHDIITIGQMAELRGISTETLRHYDRIGLFKPAYRDVDTGYRYYSLFQYEKLGTILELRNLGMNTREIQQYMKERTVASTRELLLKQQEQIVEKMEYLTRLHKELEQKIQFMKKVATTPLTGEIHIREIPPRDYLSFCGEITNDLELSYVAVHLERFLDSRKETMPVFASNRYAGVISKTDVENQTKPLAAKLVIEGLTAKEKQVENVIHIPGGQFACLYYVGNFWNREPSIDLLIRYLKDRGLTLCGDVLQVQWVDFAVTDKMDEISYEFQAPFH